ncbi:MAG TPA: glycosyltransferase [Kiritimatiellia bacterium]|nr:glycosyltransferase [Kiritimatiellia bacterium]
MPESAESSLQISVCICTFNGADRIALVVEALARQTDVTPRWDVVVVDNASRDDTSAVTREAVAAHLPGRARLIHESTPGLMHARRAATEAAAGEFIAFLDDDNIPQSDYIAQLLELLPRHPRAGVLGGRVKPEWIGEPTALGRSIASFALAICDRGDASFAYTDVTGGPAGAGMVVRRALMKTIFEESSLAGRVTGRTGTALTGGEDTAIVIRAHQLGYEVRYEPSLVIAHRIPASRTEPAYLARLYEGIGRGQAAMRPLFDPKARNPLLRRMIALKEALRWIVWGLRGPSAAVRAEFGALAPDVHRLHQRQVYGRFAKGWSG